MWRISILLFVGCSEKDKEDICFGIPDATAEEIRMDIVNWENGPEYQVPRGWTGDIFQTSSDWDSFLLENGLGDPVTDVDHSTFDILLYERIYNGCDYEVVFDGAYLFEGTRFVRAQEASLEVFCDLYSPEHAVLLLEKTDVTDVEVCSLDWD